MNDDFNMERRLLLAFLLSAVLMVVLLRPWSSPKPSPPQPPPKTPAAAPAQPGSPPAATTAAPAPAARPSAAPPTPLAAAAVQRVALNTPVYHLVFSNRGASARSWILNHYTDQDWHPLDLVDAHFSAKHGYPFEFWSEDAGLQQQLAQALYQVNLTRLKNGDQQLTFRWSGNGWSAVKTFVFGSGYEFQLSASLSRNGQPQPYALAWPGGFATSSAQNDYASERIFARQPGELQKWEPKNISGVSPIRAGYEYAGLEDKYFALAFLSDAAEITVTRMKTSYRPLVAAHGHTIAGPAVETLGVALGGSPEWRVFAGPKRLALLGGVAPHLSELVHFGWFGFAAKPLFMWMHWTYVHWIQNYGWVILFVTFVITMIMFPFRLKAQKTQVKMMALQPRIKSINDRMRKLPLKDPRRMQLQQEMMKLYQQEGVNPLGGCLPMLIPLPLIYAFYEVLETSIELRHAPWFGFYRDLAARDPYLVLPIILVATQFWFMGLVPMATGQDQLQARLVRWIMPLGLGYIFFFLPAGVNLYYLGSTLIMIGQQYVINRIYGPVTGSGAAPAAAAAKAAGLPAARPARKSGGKR